MKSTLFALAALAWSCTHSSQPARAPRPPPPLELSRLLPNDAEWIVLSRPAELWRSAAVRLALEPAITAPDLRAFASRTGADLTSLSGLVAGGYGVRGTLLALQGRDSRKSMRRALELTIRPQYSILPLRPDVVLVGLGPGTSGLLDRGRRLGLHPTPWEPRLREMRARIPEAPFQLLVLQPPTPDPTTPAAVLLASVRSAAVAVTPRGAELLVDVSLDGDFPSTAAANFRSMLEWVAETPFGQLFGLPAAARTARVGATTDRVTLQFAVAARSVSDGVQTLFLARLQDLLGNPPPAD